MKTDFNVFIYHVDFGRYPSSLSFSLELYLVTELDSITNSTHMNLSKLREMVKNKEAWHAAVHEVTESQMQLRG